MVDGFADEGHRIGAYYLIRAINVVFYETMSHPVALKLASEWIKVMKGSSYYTTTTATLSALAR